MRRYRPSSLLNVTVVALPVALAGLWLTSRASEPPKPPEPYAPAPVVRPPVLSYWFTASRNIGVRNEPDGPEMGTDYIEAGSCVVVSTNAVTPVHALKSTFTRISAYGGQAKMMFGLVDSDALFGGYPAPEQGICNARIRERPADGTLPPSPPVAGAYTQSVPDMRGRFRESRMYVLKEQAKMRSHPDQYMRLTFEKSVERPPFTKLEEGSCVFQATFGPYFQEFAHVSAFDKTGRLLHGWVMKDFLRPAPDTMEEKDCLTTFIPVPLPEFIPKTPR